MNVEEIYWPCNIAERTEGWRTNASIRFSRFTSHLLLLDICSQDWRQSLCTHLMDPEHMHGYSSGLSSCSVSRQIRHTISSSPSMAEDERGVKS